MDTLIVEKIGDRYGVIIPSDLVEKLQINMGDVVTLCNSSSSSDDQQHELEMKIVTKIIEENSNLFRRLAQS